MTDTLSRRAAAEHFYLIVLTDSGHWECVTDWLNVCQSLEAVTDLSLPEDFHTFHWTDIRKARHLLQTYIERECHVRTRDQFEAIIGAEKAIADMREAAS